MYVLTSCEKNEQQGTIVGNELKEIPDYFPTLVFPEDNEFSDARMKLGRKLFFDPILSINSSISCGSCHKPEIAFANNDRVSLGVEQRMGTRNVPSLANVAYHPYYTREGGVPTLEMQVLVPIQEHNEFDFNIIDIGARLMKNPEYVTMSQQAYDKDPDYFVIVRAIASFERTLISGRSAFDAYISGDSDALSQEELRGMNLFLSERLSCSKCHSGFDFTDYGFANNGLYNQYSDEGRYRFTKDIADMSMFKIPSLRNVSLTRPYMHDGSLETLEDVIKHYNSGGKDHVNKSELIKPLNLTENEMQDLEAFLKTLTDFKFISNQKFYEN